jgi:two-component system, cell cycle sensor histidine kinase and response regulator CckA
MATKSPPEDPTFLSWAMPRSDLLTETIEIDGLNSNQLTESGSFDLRGFRLSSLGKLLKALPIPALLIDCNFAIIFANEASQKLGDVSETLQSLSFLSLFPRFKDAANFKSILEQVFSTRRLRVSEGMVEIGANRVWGRMNFRSVRLGHAQFVLTLIEDLTLEKKHLLLIESHKEIMQQAKKKYESQLHQQTTELKVMNTRLQEEIEERTNAQAALEKSRHGFNNIVEKMSDGIAVLDRQSAIQYANRVLARFLGKTPESLLGEKLAIPLVPREYSEIDIIRLNGEPGIAEIRPTRTQWNGKASYLVVFRDVTDRKRAQKELLRVQKLESLELIASGLAHDFNNLLTANIANISLAKIRGSLDAPFYDALARAERASSKAQELCRQLLTFAKGGPPVKRPTALAPLLKETADLALSGSNVKLVLRIGDDLWTTEIEPSQISMVFQNLLINAKQAMTSGGEAVIEAENVVVGVEPSVDASQSAKGKYVRVIIKDTGSGISPENLSKIFDPYFTTKSTGSGLGLATSYTVVKKHGGRIEVESRLGVGTSFFVYLPASGRCPEAGTGENVDIVSD